MATRSRIAIELKDGRIKSIYCHWDGYISNNGKLLVDHYTDRDKVNQLIELGDISYLAPEVNPSEPHTFDKPQEGVVVAFGRDRGEKGVHHRADPDRGAFIRRGYEEYGYLLNKENQWEVIVSDGRGFEPLAVPPPANSKLQS